MIKGDYFLKLLKPLFSILLIGFFGLLGNSFVNAGKVQMIGIEGYPSIYNTQYQLTFLKGGGVLTNYLGQGKSVLGLNSNAFFWWATNGLPYFYGPYSQGFFNNYCACDVMSDYDWTPENAHCSCNTITGDAKSLFKGFFSNVKQYDLAYYDADQTYNNYPSCTQKRYQGKFCWSSSGLNSTLCFVFNNECIDTCYHSSCNGLMGGSLVNSQGLQNLTYGLISNSWIGYAPGQNGYDGSYEGNTEGSSQGNIDSTYTGDYTYGQCTYKQIVDRLENDGFSKYFCYGGLDNFDLYNPNLAYSPIPGSGKSLNQIWINASSTWDSPQEWYDFWNGLYVDRYSSQNWSDMWSSYPAVYRTWFDLLYTYGGNSKYFPWVLEYCNIVLNYDSLSNSIYKGDIFNGVCETVVDENRVGIGSSGEVIQGLNWNGVGGLSGSKTYSDPGVFITDMFTKIKSYIPTDKSDVGLGFLPLYIITFMLFLILFRFLSH